jgi:hypothetical protein
MWDEKKGDSCVYSIKADILRLWLKSNMNADVIYLNIFEGVIRTKHTSIQMTAVKKKIPFLPNDYCDLSNNPCQLSKLLLLLSLCSTYVFLKSYKGQITFKAESYTASMEANVKYIMENDREDVFEGVVYVKYLRAAMSLLNLTHTLGIHMTPLFFGLRFGIQKDAHVLIRINFL